MDVFFFIDDDDLLETYNNIWSNSIKKSAIVLK